MIKRNQEEKGKRKRERGKKQDTEKRNMRLREQGEREDLLADLMAHRL